MITPTISSTSNLLRLGQRPPGPETYRGPAGGSPSSPIGPVCRAERSSSSSPPTAACSPSWVDTPGPALLLLEPDPKLESLAMTSSRRGLPSRPGPAARPSDALLNSSRSLILHRRCQKEEKPVAGPLSGS
ncbi:S-adenosyl-L-methionine-dependentmethyltransferases superfamily protein [Striga asiatica]|uniref:S-adenosyl-L-methionine-dependentmethyltransferases superfamily protein n=1 Tax=Striga asiatica TaxID=4170 RepID=A0A5A7QAZ3_STRAF|nr:S-adenosyl-L-methionine-dependentmethyltransferases superfamily protein [Striga asiatica]